MRVVLDYYYNDLEQRCTGPECDFRIGPYEEEWPSGFCPRCSSNLGFFRAFGTEEQRSKPVKRSDARVAGIDY